MGLPHAMHCARLQEYLPQKAENLLLHHLQPDPEVVAILLSWCLVLVSHFTNKDSEAQRGHGISRRWLLVDTLPFLWSTSQDPISPVRTILFQCCSSWCGRQYDLVERAWLSRWTKPSSSMCPLCHWVMYFNHLGCSSSTQEKISLCLLCKSVSSSYCRDCRMRTGRHICPTWNIYFLFAIELVADISRQGDFI